MTMLSDFLNRFPDFDVAIATTYVPIYENVYRAYYNTLYGVTSFDDEVILNVIAHLITMFHIMSTSTGSSVGGAVTSRTVDGVSEDYSVATNLTVGASDWWYKTAYGQVFMTLTSKFKGGAVIV